MRTMSQHAPNRWRKICWPTPTCWVTAPASPLTVNSHSVRSWNSTCPLPSCRSMCWKYIGGRCDHQPKYQPSTVSGLRLVDPSRRSFTAARPSAPDRATPCCPAGRSRCRPDHPRSRSTQLPAYLAVCPRLQRRPSTLCP